MSKYRKCAVIVLMKDNLAFAGERLDIKNAWQFPQGGVDEGETYVQAAVRELYEETGVLNAKFVKATKRVYKYKFPESVRETILYKYGDLSYCGQQQVFCLFNFTGLDMEIDIRCKDQEFRSWRWMPIRDIADGIVYFKKKSYVKALKELELL